MKDGPCATSVTTPSPEELRVVTYDITPCLQESLDQGIPLPPLPRYPKWYLPHRPLSPSPNSSTGIPTDSWEMSTQMSSPPQSPSSSPQKRGAGSSGQSKRPSLYAWQMCVPWDPSQRLRMQAKSLLHRQIEESGNIHLVMVIWKSVLGQGQAMWDHDVLGCWDCVLMRLGFPGHSKASFPVRVFPHSPSGPALAGRAFYSLIGHLFYFLDHGL